jgi:hypothetical protein
VAAMAVEAKGEILLVSNTGSITIKTYNASCDTP